MKNAGLVNGVTSNFFYAISERLCISPPVSIEFPVKQSYAVVSFDQTFQSQQCFEHLDGYNLDENIEPSCDSREARRVLYCFFLRSTESASGIYIYICFDIAFILCLILRCIHLLF